jgi:hypothetical protein
VTLSLSSSSSLRTYYSLYAEHEEVARAPPLRRLWAFELLVSCWVLSLRPRAVV